MTHPDPDDLPAADEPLDDELRALIARAESLPTLRPSRDLWPDIAARLDAAPPSRSSDHRVPERLREVDREPTGARVLAFPAPRTPIALTERWHWLAAAAVALMTASSGATYLAMRRPAAPPTVAAVTAAPEQPTVADRPPTPAPDTMPARVADGRAASHGESRTESRTESRAERRVRPTLRSVARSVDVAVPGAADYDREITELRAVVAERHGELDSATVDVLARNLRIIDAAIAASRAALARDPHSPFLGEQLTRALGQKVDLLRTAALLPHT